MVAVLRAPDEALIMQVGDSPKQLFKCTAVLIASVWETLNNGCHRSEVGCESRSFPRGLAHDGNIARRDERCAELFCNSSDADCFGEFRCAECVPNWTAWPDSACQYQRMLAILQPPVITLLELDLANGVNSKNARARPPQVRQ